MSDYPNLSEQAKNLAKFSFEVLKHAMSGESLMCSDEIILQRRAICESCDRRDPIPNRCMECGCYLDPKIQFALDSCPLGKWKETDEDWMKGGFEKFLEKLNQKRPGEDFTVEQEQPE
jgi:hypothetical protein